jgi:hypothetical protein
MISTRFFFRVIPLYTLYKKSTKYVSANEKYEYEKLFDYELAI